MIIPPDDPQDSEINAAREELACSLQLLKSVLDNPPGDLNHAELSLIRTRRATRMRDAANALYNAVLGRRTR